MKLIRKTIVPYNGKVHDLTVESSHTYNVEGKAVHNSAGGSLLAWALGITQLDSIKYGLLFERFLTKKKKGYPDVDCLSSNTKVLQPNNSTTILRNLVVGDTVLDMNGLERKVLAVQTRFSTSEDELRCIFINIGGVFGSIVANHKHRLVTDTGIIVQANQIQPGDHLHSLSGPVTVVSNIIMDSLAIELTDITVEETATFQIVPFNVLLLEENNKKMLVNIGTYSSEYQKTNQLATLHSCNELGLAITSHNSDFSDRDRAVKIIQEYFGIENVIPVSNFLQLQLKSLIKDLCRLYNLPFDEVNALTRNIEAEVLSEKKKEPGFDRAVYVLVYEDAESYSPSFNQILSRWPQIKDPMAVLFKQMRGVGRHAGGVIITDEASKNMPLILSGKGDSKALQTPWPEGVNYRHLEEFGFLKFDILGIGTLRMFDQCIRKILKRHKGIAEPTFSDVQKFFYDNLHPDTQDFDDMKVYEHVYHNNNFCGIFQFCISEEALITMADQTTKLLKDVLVGDNILSYNESTKMFEGDVVEAVYEVSDKEVIRLTMEDASVVELTPDHKVLTTNRGWVEAQNLTNEDDVKTI